MTFLQVRCAASLSIVVALLARCPAPAATIEGRLLEPGVVWVTDDVAVRPVVAEMRNTGKTFVPSLLAVPVGSTVRFPNDDPFFHSIFSASDADAFDIGFYPAGPGKEQTFDRAGVLDVRCHIHALMRANIVVVDGPYAIADVMFSVGNVGSGERSVHVWGPQRGLRTTTVRLSSPDATVALNKPL